MKLSLLPALAVTLAILAAVAPLPPAAAQMLDEAPVELDPDTDADARAAREAARAFLDRMMAGDNDGALRRLAPADRPTAAALPDWLAHVRAAYALTEMPAMQRVLVRDGSVVVEFHGHVRPANASDGFQMTNTVQMAKVDGEWFVRLVEDARIGVQMGVQQVTAGPRDTILDRIVSWLDRERAATGTLPLGAGDHGVAALRAALPELARDVDLTCIAIDGLTLHIDAHGRWLISLPLHAGLVVHANHLGMRFIATDGNGRFVEASAVLGLLHQHYAAWLAAGGTLEPGRYALDDALLARLNLTIRDLPIFIGHERSMFTLVTGIGGEHGGWEVRIDYPDGWSHSMAADGTCTLSSPATPR